MRRLAVLVAVLSLAACQRTEDKPVITVGSGSGSGSAVVPAPRTKGEQVKPPLDLKEPPLDATKTPSGLVYKSLASSSDPRKPLRNDTVMISYTGWRQTTGETFFTNKNKGQPMPLALANTAPGFAEAIQRMRVGERAMLWLPPSIGYKGEPPPGAAAETLVYEVELHDVVPAPIIPVDLAPTKAALKFPSGISYAVAKPGTGKDKARVFDTVTFNYTAWDSTGRMFDSTEIRRRPPTVAPFRQSPVMEEILTAMTVGERLRVWIPADRMQQDGKPLPGLPEGILTYEVEMISIAKGTAPPPTPPDVGAIPADAKKTPKGVGYKVLHAGKGGPHPAPGDTVKLHYTGWSTDGRMFDSSVAKNEPAEVALDGVIAGWTEGIPLMSVGDRFRFWIPDTLAFKGAVGRPQGMLVFEIELLEIKPAPKPAAPAAEIPK